MRLIACLKWGCAGLVGICLPIVSWLVFVAPRRLESLTQADLIHYFSWTIPLLIFVIWLSRRIDQKIARDNLTILYNQPAFFELAQRHFQIGVRYDDHMSIIMLDLDHFKDVNDGNNHLVGTALLKQVAEIIASDLRDTDIAARFGGDEFIICLPRTKLGSATIVAERIKEKIAGQVFKVRDRDIKVTASLGLATMRCRYKYSIDRLVERADQHLYEAKKAGRNTVVVDHMNEVDG